MPRRTADPREQAKPADQLDREADPGRLLTNRPGSAASRQITTLITTCGDACSPHPLVSFPQTNERSQRRRGRATGRSTNIATHASTDDHYRTGRYEIRVKGHLDARWAAW